MDKQICLFGIRSAPLPTCRALLRLIVTAGIALQAAMPPTCDAAGSDGDYKAGIASIAVTPDQPMWMSGYAARTKPSEGKVHDLRAKALALEDAQSVKLVILTLDLLGITSQMRDWLEDELGRRYRLSPEGLLINASHTHSGPVLHKPTESIYGDSFYEMNAEQIEQSREYTEKLLHKLADLVGRALDDLAPARLAYTHARAGFAMNRRSRVEQDYQIQPNPDGPVDHDVPVLRIDDAEGKLRAVVFGYACHGTTLSAYEFCGDYAGFAQEYVEQKHPGTAAFFIAGCGGDQNPYPRHEPGALQYCMDHGRALANAVETALIPRAKPIAGPLRVAFDTVTLEFAPPPTREQLNEQAESKDKYDRRHAEILLDELERNGKIRTTYPYPIQVVEFGDDLTIVALAGEVVVDYSLRLKNELKDHTLWVAGYSNDVFGYLPSLRALNEGGYEGGEAMRYTELPGPFAPSVETLVIDKVHELVKSLRMPKDR